MKIKISKGDVIWSYVGYFFTLFTNVIILPFVMKLVPTIELGLWYTFLSVGQIVSIFDGTFTGSVSRNITYAWSGMKSIQAEGFVNNENVMDGPNYRLLISILMTCKKIFSVVSVAALAFLISAGTIYIGYTASEINFQIWISAWIIYIAGVFFNLYYSYWITALKGIGAMQQAQKASVAAKIVQIAVSLTGLYFGGGIIALSAAYLLSGLILRTVGKYSFMHYENIKNSYKKYYTEVGKQEIKSNFKLIWHNAKKNGISCVGAFGITQTATLLCSAYIGLEETASYGLCLQIINALTGFALIYFNTICPRLTELKVGGQKTKKDFINLMSLSVSVYWVMYALELVAVIFLGLPVIRIIKSNTEIPVKMLVFIGIYLFLENNHAMFSKIIEMSNIVPYVKACLISAALIVIGQVFTAKFTSFGIYGLMAVQCVVQLCYNNWKWPSVILKSYSLDPIKIIKLGFNEGINIMKKVMKRG